MLEEIEKKVYNEYVKKLIYVEDGIENILQQDLEKLQLTKQEDNFLRYIIKKHHIQIVTEKISKDDRSQYVRDNDYGNISGNELYRIDEPVLSKIEYSEAGDTIYEDYSELDEFIEKDFLDKNIHFKQKKNSDGIIENYKTIRLCDLLKLKLSEKELEQAFTVLEELDTRIVGKGSTFDGEFSNYDYISTYKSSNLPPALSKEENIEKFIKFKDNQDSKIREEIITGNMRLVPFVVSKIYNKYNVDPHELEQYGYEGLIKAVDRFDVNKGYSFSTYAIYYIRGYVLKGITEILNEKSTNDYYSYLNAIETIEEKNSSTIEENPSLINDVIELLIEKKKIANNKKAIDLAKRKILSFGIKKENYGDYLELEELQGDNVLTDLDYYEEIVISAILKDEMRKALSTLLPMEQEFLKLRFGLDDNSPKSLNEIGRIFNLSIDRIRQIEFKTLNKLRHPSISSNLRSFYK